MFTLSAKNESYWYPVQVEIPAKEGGRKQKFTFDAEFNHLEQDDINDMLRKREDDEPVLKDADVLDRVLVGWRGVNDSDGHTLEVNADNRTRFLNVFPVTGSIVRAYLKSIGIEGKTKN